MHGNQWFTLSSTIFYMRGGVMQMSAEVVKAASAKGGDTNKHTPSCGPVVHALLRRVLV
jgi:hypothetical protein